MTLPLSGPLGLSDVNVELGYSPTAVITLNDVEVRALVGILSGTISIDDFYGATSTSKLGIFQGGWDIDTQYNTVQIIDSNGTFVSTRQGCLSTIDLQGGADIDDHAIFYAGGYWDGKGTAFTNFANYNTETSFTTATNVGTIRYGLAGAGIPSTAVFYGGVGPKDVVTRLDYNAAIIGSETNVGTARAILAGAGLGSTALFYAGAPAAISNIVTRINSSGAIIGSETNVGTSRHALAGAAANDATAIFYGGFITASINTVTRINSSGVIIGSETSVGTIRHYHAGASMGTMGMFYGGTNVTTIFDTVTRINDSGTIIGSETNIGTERYALAGAGITN